MFFIYYIDRNRQLYSQYIPDDIRRESLTIKSQDLKSNFLNELQKCISDKKELKNSS